MSPFNRQVGLPAGVAVILAAAAFGVNQAVGPQPVAWLFKYGTVLFYVPWLISLVLISAVAVCWAQRSGASVRGRLLVAASPGSLSEACTRCWPCSLSSQRVPVGTPCTFWMLWDIS